MLVLLECENTLVGIFVTVIAIVFDHAPAENQGFAELSYRPCVLSNMSRSFCDRQTDNDSLDQKNVQFYKRKTARRTFWFWRSFLLFKKG
jgi:hypothetical protein